MAAAASGRAYAGVTFEAQWTDLTKQQTRDPGTVEGGKRQMLTAPQYYPKDRIGTDWVLVLKRK